MLPLVLIPWCVVYDVLGFRDVDQPSFVVLGLLFSCVRECCCDLGRTPCVGLSVPTSSLIMFRHFTGPKGFVWHVGYGVVLFL